MEYESFLEQWSPRWAECIHEYMWIDKCIFALQTGFSKTITLGI